MLKNLPKMLSGISQKFHLCLPKLPTTRSIVMKILKLWLLFIIIIISYCIKPLKECGAQHNNIMWLQMCIVWVYVKIKNIGIKCT